MLFNTTYKPNLSLKDSVITVSWIKNQLIAWFAKKGKLIELIPPAFSQEDDPINILMENQTRETSADLSDSAKVVTLYQTYSNWMRSIIHKANINNVFLLSTTVWRDLIETPVSTSSKQEITFQFSIKRTSDFDFLAKEWILDLYQLFTHMAKFIEKKYQIKNILPSKVNFVTAQQLENEMPSISFVERELEVLLDEDAFVLSSAGKKLYSGKIHTYIPPEIYDLQKFHQIILKDRINVSPIKVASVSILASGQQLADQLTLLGKLELKSEKFYQRLIEDDQKIIEVKINIPRLALALLGKAHVSEVQPGVVSEESDIISTRYKVEKY